MSEDPSKALPFPEPDPEPDPRPEQFQKPAAGSELPDAGIYREFRRQAASTEALDSYFRALAKALRFNGEFRITFEHGRIVWAELREEWWMPKAPRESGDGS